jgi:AhpD family alkylhydroperoxidase
VTVEDDGDRVSRRRSADGGKTRPLAGPRCARTGPSPASGTREEDAAMADTVSRAEIESEIKDTLGLVPHFFTAIPTELLGPEWEIFKRLELGETLIPNKYKELIGIGIHSETKCRYCTLFHTEAAKLFGATDEEIQEAVEYAKTTLGWSAYINGMQEDYDEFAAELKQITDYVRSKAA